MGLNISDMPESHKKAALWIGVGAAVVGISLVWVDPAGWLENLLGSLLGVLIMLVAVLWLISGLEDRRDEKEWEQVRDVTYMQVADMMIAFVSYLCGPLPQPAHGLIRPLSDAMKRPEEHGSDTLRTFAEAARAIDADAYNGLDDPVRYVVEELPLAEESLTQLQNLLIPRILRLSPNSELHNRLLALDDAIRRLRLSINGYLQGQPGSTGPDVLGHGAHYAEAAANVYEAMLADGWTQLDLEAEVQPQADDA